ncbi:MAG: polysulfide reductase NrfD [Bradyrhizobium sp.]|uniref:NrfD/PsrC family molybdoenzyme membrane anchor subunit n=1 Tax=Bradyrhizobium sp. TaxID=376 RepID=UPI0025B8A571|nr:NrfD/PsrC family molybdoenzyme membrane anchor subunit [Bradyrhizobium sp.]MBI5262723.1 polysulfide reductase NrfD [Bradyrhizobium sp.]
MADFNIFHHMPWEPTYAIYFFVIGISAALFFFSALSWFNDAFLSLRHRAFYASFVLLVIGGLLLIGDLSQPMRFINILNPFYLNFASPLAWGGLNLVSFGLVSVLYYLAMSTQSPHAKVLGIIGSLLALGLPVYTGFDLTVHQNRPVWNTPLMPVLFVAMSIVSGAAVATFLALGEERLQGVLRAIILWSAGAVAVMLVSLLGTTAYGGVGQELTFMLMTSGMLGLIFLGLGIAVGLAAPIALLLVLGRNATGTMAASVLLLIGGMALRYSILIGGQLVQTYF